MWDIFLLLPSFAFLALLGYSSPRTRQQVQTPTHHRPIMWQTSKFGEIFDWQETMILGCNKNIIATTNRPSAWTDYCNHQYSTFHPQLAKVAILPKTLHILILTGWETIARKSGSLRNNLINGQGGSNEFHISYSEIR